MTKMNDAAEARRESFEIGLGAIAHAQRRLQLVALRVDQAQRTGGVWVLDGTMKDLDAAYEKLNLAWQNFGDIWKDGDWEA